MISLHGDVQRRDVVVQRDLRVNNNRGEHGGVGVVVEKQLDHGGVGSSAGHDEGRNAVAIHRVDVDVSAEEQTRNVQAVLAHRPVERSADLRIGAQREVCSLREEELDDGLAAVSAGDLDGGTTLVVGVDVRSFRDQERHRLHVVAKTGVAQRSVAHLIDHLQLQVQARRGDYAFGSFLQDPFADFVASRVGSVMDSRMALSVLKLSQNGLHRRSLLL